MIEDIAPQAVWQALRDTPDAALVDVRTLAEWQFVGLPDLSALGKRVICIEWQRFPSGEPNRGFLQELTEAGIAPGAPVYFLCRSGVRSLAAAEAAAAAGYGQSFNVADGFEGPHDAQGHRGGVAGWKAAGLPWRQ